MATKVEVQNNYCYSTWLKQDSVTGESCDPWEVCYCWTRNYSFWFTCSAWWNNWSEITLPAKPSEDSLKPGWLVEVLLYVHRSHRLIGDGSPGKPPQLSHSSWALSSKPLNIHPQGCSSSTSNVAPGRVLALDNQYNPHTSDSWTPVQPP